MHDFIGNPFAVGSWVATSGQGNRSAEYGMLLGQVGALDPLRIKRLTVHYVGGIPHVGTREIIVKNPNKWVVVQPCAPVEGLFGRALAGTGTPSDDVLVGQWIHGKIPNLFT